MEAGLLAAGIGACIQWAQFSILAAAYHPITIVSMIVSLAWKLAPLLSRKKNMWTGKELNFLEKIVYGGISSFAKDWHDYEVHNVENISKGNCLLIGYHSRPTLDLTYLVSYINCHILVTHLMFYIPVVGTMLPFLGVISSKGGVRDHAEDTFIETLTKGERPLLLLPGGAFECMKPYDMRFRLQWKEEPGFARVIVNEPALRQNTKVVPFYTQNCELSLWSTEWWYTWSGKGVSKLMKRFAKGYFGVLPLMMVLLLCSLGFFPLPAPVKLDTHFGEPLTLQDGETAVAFAARVKASLQELIDRLNADTKKEQPARKHTRRHWLYTLFLGSFTLLQNIVLHSMGAVVLLFVLFPLLLVFGSLYQVWRTVVRFLLKSKSKRPQPPTSTDTSTSTKSDDNKAEDSDSKKKQ